MSNKSYQAYMDVLRSREVRPEFSKIAAVVESAAVPRISVTRSVLTALLLIVAGSLVLSSIDRTSTPAIPSMQNEAVSRVRRTVRVADDQKIAAHTVARRTVYKGETSLAKQLTFAVSTDASTHSADVPNKPTNGEPPPIELCNPLPVSSVSRQMALKTTVLQSINLESDDVPKWSVFVGGSAARQFSSESMLRSNSIGDLFAGVGYRLSHYLTVSILGGRTEYLLPASSSVMTYRDTTFEHGNQTYHNVIGSLVPISTSSPSHSYWLGGSILYSFGDIWRPRAEIGGAVSQQGLVLRESVGVAKDISESLEATLSAQGTQLNPASLWLTKIGLSLSIGYCF